VSERDTYLFCCVVCQDSEECVFSQLRRTTVSIIRIYVVVVATDLAISTNSSTAYVWEHVRQSTGAPPKASDERGMILRISLFPGSIDAVVTSSKGVSPISNRTTHNQSPTSFLDSYLIGPLLYIFPRRSD